MHASILAGLVAASALVAACDRPAAAPALRADSGAGNGERTGTSARLDDGRPQTGLPRMKVFVGTRELSAELALTSDAILKGMMWRTNVADTDAMLFAFGAPHRTAFWMKNVPIDIDIAYIDPEGAILEIHRMQRQNTNPVPAATDRVQFTLETAAGWYERHGIRTGMVVTTERGGLRETFLRRPTRR